MTTSAACERLLNVFQIIPARGKVFFFSFLFWMSTIYRREKARNVYLWSKTKTHFFGEVERNPPHVMVWAAVSATSLIGPYFFDGAINLSHPVTRLVCSSTVSPRTYRSCRLSKIKHQLINRLRCENNSMKYFLTDGLDGVLSYQHLSTGLPEVPIFHRVIIRCEGISNKSCHHALLHNLRIQRSRSGCFCYYHSRNAACNFTSYLVARNTLL